MCFYNSRLGIIFQNNFIALSESFLLLTWNKNGINQINYLHSSSFLALNLIVLEIYSTQVKESWHCHMCLEVYAVGSKAGSTAIISNIGIIKPYSDR